MARYNNAYCRICGAAYHRCNCKSQGSWRKVTDTAEHYQIFCVIRDYVAGVIDARKASKLLKKCDLSERENFDNDIKKVIYEIEEKSTPKQKTDKVEATDSKKESSDGVDKAVE